jgi:nucleoside-diphosphate-sugar epimerase
MKSVLITGTGGFIGRESAAVLRQAGGEVPNLDVTRESISAVWAGMNPRPALKVIYYVEPRWLTS